MSKQNKKGVSTIIASVIMIALTLVIGGVIWGVVSNLVQENLESAGSCYDVFDKVDLNPGTTCWNSSGKEVRFSINVKDLDIQEMIVSISGTGETKSYRLKKDGVEPVGKVVYWPNASITPVLIPGSNTGKTYSVFNDFTAKPDSIKVFPVIKGKQCDAADSISNMDSCLVLS